MKIPQIQNIFKRKTREQQVEKRTASVLSELLRISEFEFTDLERVQVLNNVRRELAGHLRMKQATYLEMAVNNSQLANETKGALEYIE